jgi:predicted short-subunit dehydrogenase-like oxidoreductase (DUF2520 family)
LQKESLKTKPISVVLLGGGNVAIQFAKNLLSHPFAELVQIYARDLSQLEVLKDETKKTDSLDDLVSADIYIFAISDNSINEVSSHPFFQDKFVVHTSGATAVRELVPHKNGVLYPPFSLSKELDVRFKDQDFFIESQSAEQLELLQNIVEGFGAKSHLVNSEQRLSFHTAAVFVNNFTNHLYALGMDLAKSADIPNEFMEDLLLKGVQKSLLIGADKAQTGPAIRGDSQTMKLHLANLDENKKNIYKILSESIQKRYDKKL